MTTDALTAGIEGLYVEFGYPLESGATRQSDAPLFITSTVLKRYMWLRAGCFAGAYGMMHALRLGEQLWSCYSTGTVTWEEKVEIAKYALRVAVSVGSVTVIPLASWNWYSNGWPFQMTWFWQPGFGSDAINCLMQAARNASCINANLLFGNGASSYSYEGSSSADNAFLQGAPYAPWGTSINRPPWPTPPPASPPLVSPP